MGAQILMNNVKLRVWHLKDPAAGTAFYGNNDKVEFFYVPYQEFLLTG